MILNFKLKFGIVAIVLYLFLKPLYADTLDVNNIVPNDRESVIKGFSHLFNITESEARERNELIKNAMDFKQKYIDYVAASEAPKANFVKKSNGIFEVSFPSLIQRLDNDPSNMVRGFLYVPSPLRKKNSTKKAAATIIIHHVADDIGPEKLLAKIASTTDRGVVFVMFLPHYGPRKGNKLFITNNQSDFELNILQSILDIEQSRVMLSNLNYVDQNQLQLMGISLGALITLIDMGFDSGFKTYGTLVGGADIAHIMSYRKEEDPNSETSQALADVHWTEEQGREFLSRFDPMTWAPAVNNKEIFMWNAWDDELMNRDVSVKRIAEELKLYGNDVHLKFHEGKHRVNLKEMGYLKFIKKILLPVMKFYGGE